MTPVRYFINGTYDASLNAPVCGYSSTLGFGSDGNGLEDLWVHNVLSQENDDSYLFLGGGYHTTPADHGSPVRARSAFALDYDLNNAYTGGSPAGAGEAVPTSPVIPLLPHTWTVIFRWRAVGGTPAGREDSDPAFSIPINVLGTPSTLTKTWAESSPVFRTDTLSIRNSGTTGSPSSEFGKVSPTFASEALRDTLTNPPEGPNYLPVQLAWITVTGPTAPTVTPRGRPGYRRGHFI
jgi:hypothetical protein